MNVFPAVVKIAYTAYGMKFDMPAFNEGCKLIKEEVKMLNTHLATRSWIAAERLTLADIAMFVALSNGFAIMLDAGFRKAMPHASAWFTKMSQLPCIVRNMGYVKMCDKAYKPVEASKCVAVEKSEVKLEAAPAKKADDDFDPFADDSEEDAEAAAAAKAALNKKAEDAKDAKDKKQKPKVIAKSILVWEVKPYSAETDLDALAKRIIATEIDGLVWKTEYKKEPVAFGVFKLNIGAVIEDEKVSADDV
jgi:elongation factor 1-beta